MSNKEMEHMEIQIKELEKRMAMAEMVIYKLTKMIEEENQ